MSDDDDRPVLTARPYRDDYADADGGDLRDAIKAALADDDWSHHRRGRYTATTTFTELDPDMKPGVKTKVVRVTACEREVIADIPADHADELLAVLGGDDA